MTLQVNNNINDRLKVAQKDLKRATRNWLIDMHSDYPFALTLTLKQTLTEQTPVGQRRRAITRHDAVKMAEQFKRKLNRGVFGKRASEKYGKSVKIIPVLEGVRSNKNLHLHFAIGGLPSHIDFDRFTMIVFEAKKYVPNIDQQYDVQNADSGWMDYIVKETSAKDTDNVLWHLAE